MTTLYKSTSILISYDTAGWWYCGINVIFQPNFDVIFMTSSTAVPLYPGQIQCYCFNLLNFLLHNSLHESNILLFFFFHFYFFLLLLHHWLNVNCMSALSSGFNSWKLYDTTERPPKTNINQMAKFFQIHFTCASKNVMICWYNVAADLNCHIPGVSPSFHLAFLLKW